MQLSLLQCFGYDNMFHMLNLCSIVSKSLGCLEGKERKELRPFSILCTSGMGSTPFQSKPIDGADNQLLELLIIACPVVTFKSESNQKVRRQISAELKNNKQILTKFKIEYHPIYLRALIFLRRTVLDLPRVWSPEFFSLDRHSRETSSNMRGVSECTNKEILLKQAWDHARKKWLRGYPLSPVMCKSDLSPEDCYSASNSSFNSSDPNSQPVSISSIGKDSLMGNRKEKNSQMTRGNEQGSPIILFLQRISSYDKRAKWK